MNCRLCNKADDLRNSHIIPEFMYSSLYDEKHRFYEISTDIEKKNKLPQKGVRERLLCGVCEQHIGQYERYASLVLKGGIELQIANEGRMTHVSGIEYSRFKLFALSVLWRAGVSSLDFFRQVSLGPHEPKLRSMILNSDPGKEDAYPFIMTPIIHSGELQEALIVMPTWTRVGTNFAYRFVFGGYGWVIIVSGNGAPSEFVGASINRKNELTMLSWELSDMRFLVDMAQELSMKGKL
jgi:hypothetical protein